jgi:hypothetical protein
MKKALPIYFYDTETEGFGGNSITATYTEISGEETHVTTGYGCIEDSIDHIISLHPIDDLIRIYIHNASFDIMRFKAQLSDSVVSIQQNGTAFISGAIAYKNKILVVRDSLALLPSSLKKLSQSFCPELPKLDLDFEKEAFDYTNPDHIEYAKRDVDTLKLIIVRYANIINVKPESLAITAASQSFKRLKQVYTENIGKYYAVDRETNTKFRDFYYGGRIYIRNGHCIDEKNDTVSLDITSSYPHQMRAYQYPLAGRSPAVSMGRIPSIALKGRYLVTVKVTDYKATLPILPVRIEGTPVYPHGTFTSNITDHEYEILTNAQKGEYSKLEVITCYYWREKDCDFIFRDYVNEAYTLKLRGDELNVTEAGSGEALRTIGKINLNSPYGKLAQQYIEEGEPLGWGEGYENLNPFGKTGEKPKHDNDHRNVHLAAMITSSGRCQLYRAIYYYGVDNVVYSDTDSVKVKTSVFNTLPVYHDQGNELGQWKPEGEFNQLRVIAPKVYVATEITDVKTKKSIKSKGTPPSGMAGIVCDGVTMSGTLDNFYEAMQTHREHVKISYKEKPTKLKTFLSIGVMALKSVKTVTQPHNVKGMTYNPDNRTYSTITI